MAEDNDRQENQGTTYNQPENALGKVKGDERSGADYGPGYGIGSENYTVQGGSYSRQAQDRQGPYSGMGPEGHGRQDEAILDQIVERLTQHGRIDARRIIVQVNHGRVTLGGFVGSRRQKEAAEEVVRSVSGIGEVRNHLSVWKSGDTAGQVWGSTARGILHVGQMVIGQDGRSIGTVKALRGDDFWVNRPLKRDVYIPYAAVERVDASVFLNLPADEVDQQDWPIPGLLGSPPISRRRA